MEATAKTVINPPATNRAATGRISSALIAAINDWLERVKERLTAQAVEEILSNLDNQTREDFGVLSERKNASSDITREVSGEFLREIFSWTRFSK
jgi:vacuolar-type H+-ATPase subunit E/Vma4